MAERDRHAIALLSLAPAIDVVHFDTLEGHLAGGKVEALALQRAHQRLTPVQFMALAAMASGLKTMDCCQAAWSRINSIAQIERHFVGFRHHVRLGRRELQRRPASRSGLQDVLCVVSMPQTGDFELT
ncbi:hypothetical protein [Hydrogenophaga sp. PAMC20947]|uniref:hypothetical protein n=1 Tax=Hydrogenophaga sp. PAMC20947 TaxID=2565558 RepID=UPI00109DB18B|nr:hypothetical protein [Hydrogenophaga sp. PAMC20947]QCB47908.1 hypothetical protein E5678_18860 [Hydrogenophaga sp. PAMC20947]